MLGLVVVEWRRGKGAVLVFQMAAETHALSAGTLANNVVQTNEGAAADEKNIGRIHLQKFLLGVLPAALGRHARHGPLDDLQQSLLHAFAGHISRDRWIIRLTRYFIDLIDIDDAALRFLDVVVGSLQEVQDNILNVLTDISRLSQAGRVRDRKRDLQKPG